MRRSSLAAAALLALAAGTAPLSAQTNSFSAGALVNSPSLAGFSTTGGDMVGMALTLDIAGGGTLNAAWAVLGGGLCGGSFANGFTITLGCGTDTFTGTWAITNVSNDGINSLRMNGAPGRTLFDCGFNAGGDCSNTGSGDNSVGTAGSSQGYSMETIAGGTYLLGVSGFYTNAVSVAGNDAVGDLYEQLTIQFDAILGSGGSYNFRADTDNSNFDDPPPTIVPEPSTYALMFSGLVGIGVMARRRRQA